MEYLMNITHGYFIYGGGLIMRACKNFPEKNNTEEENKILKKKFKQVRIEKSNTSRETSTNTGENNMVESYRESTLRVRIV